MSTSEKKRVLLCGTQYGQVYLPAIAEEREMELVGILAKGSDRSVRLSEQQGVKLYTDIEQLDESVDIACVALNERIATPIANTLLQGGVATLIEHPVSVGNIRSLLATAKQYDSICHINTHFSRIAPVADFIQQCKKLNQHNSPHAIHINCNSRTLFSTIDILMHCFGFFELKNIDVSSAGSYRNCTLYLDDIPCTLSYQSWRYQQDDSTDSPLGHQICVTYPNGVLSLAGTYGPSLWFPLISADLPLSSPLYQSLQTQHSVITDVSTMRVWRHKANRQALQDLMKAEFVKTASLSSEYLEYLCELWTHLFPQLGAELVGMPSES